MKEIHQALQSTFFLLFDLRGAELKRRFRWLPGKRPQNVEQQRIDCRINR